MAQPRFIFPLQSLLEHRLQQEKERQRVVAEIQQQIQTLARDIEDAEFRIASENKKLTAEKLTGTLDMQYIALEKCFVGNLHLKIALTTQKIAEIEKTLTAARAELLLAARARKVIEKLKEKQFERWRHEQNRKEADLLDEIGTQIAMRNATPYVPQPEPALTLPEGDL